MSAAMAHPRLYTIPPDAPFLDTLARAILDGDLPVGGGKAPDKLELSQWTILLPTRRAVRALGEAFLRVSGGDAMLLPQIRALGDPEEDALALAAPPEIGDGTAALELDPAIGTLERRLALTRLILAWSRTLSESDADVGFRRPATPAQASSLSAQLAVFMDTLDTEHADLSGLKDMVPDQFAEHWQKTLEFLKIVTEYWPAHLEEHGVMAPYARRDALMKLETDRLKSNPPGAPVIAAGSTATAPATANLLEAIARLDRGAVVLPGLDLALDEESWHAISQGEGHPEHPQFGMQRFLAHIGVPRGEVHVLGEGATGRSRLVSEVMRPAGATEKWEGLRSAVRREEIDSALTGLSRIDAPTEQDEAEVISLLLRHAAEQPGKTAALVTPDRVLARRVSVRLEKWGLAVDDSAGRPLDKTMPGSFLDALAEAARSGFAPVPLLALLKHPLTLMGRGAGEMRRTARRLELTALRQPAVGKGFEAYRKARERSLTAVSEHGHAHSSVRRLGKKDWDAVAGLLDELEAAFAPLTALFAQDAEAVGLKDLVRAHLEVAQALTRRSDGAAPALWRGDAGEALHAFVCSMLDVEGEGIAVAPGDYLELQRSFMAGIAVRPRTPAHPRIHIWGPLEARLQRPDMVVLGGLNEGTWPATIESDPWLSRPMRSRVGLSAPERQTGLAAHDVAQLMGVSEVWLTRAEKSGGTPSVPSRWLLRLDAVLAGLGIDDGLKPADPWLGWARARDAVAAVEPIKAPTPCPPLDARPKRLSVTRIEAWIANPYAIFARDILKLSKLDDIAAEPDAALKGSLVHAILQRFAEAHPAKLPNDIEAELMRFASMEFDLFADLARIETFWRGHFARFARWFAATEPGRRLGVEKVHAEAKGEITFGDGFTLSARADRIDEGADGSLVIYDYKTGTLPSTGEVKAGKAPQLPLEAVMAGAGAFESIAASPVSRLVYISARGYGEGGEERDAGKDVSVEELAGEAREKLEALIAAYAKEKQPYTALRRSGFASSNAYRYDNFAHLARVKEWQSAGEGED